MWEMIGSIFTGGLTGLLGSGITVVAEHYKQKQKNEHELATAKIEQDTMRLEMEGQERISEIEGETQKSVAEAAAFTQSMKSDKATYTKGSGSGWLVAVDFFRGVTRPFVTWYLIGLVTAMYITTTQPDMEQKIILTTLYITTTVILWWFGSRMRKPS